MRAVKRVTRESMAEFAREKAQDYTLEEFAAQARAWISHPQSVCVTQSCTVGIGGGNGFLGPVGHRQMMNPSVMNLEHRPS